MEWDRHFHIEINSLEAFAAFVAILRGEAIDDDILQQLTKTLLASTRALSDAEKANSEKR